MTTKTILVVDDSRVSRMMISAVIKNLFPEWGIVEAGNADEALVAIKENSNIDLVILDFNMPGMDGLELAERLVGLLPNAKLSLLTANIQDSIQRKASELGIGFVKKPITQDKIEGILSYA